MGCGWDVGNPARGFFHPFPALQANPSLSMPIGMASPRTAGEQGHVPALQPLQQGRPAQAAVVSSGVSVPVSLPVGRALLISPAQLPRLPCSISPATFLPPGACSVPSSAIAQCPSRQRRMGEDVLMVAWVRCVLAACTPWGSDGISALIHSPPSYPSHQGDVDLSPCGCPC